MIRVPLLKTGFACKLSVLLCSGVQLSTMKFIIITYHLKGQFVNESGRCSLRNCCLGRTKKDSRFARLQKSIWKENIFENLLFQYLRMLKALDLFEIKPIHGVSGCFLNRNLCTCFIVSKAVVKPWWDKVSMLLTQVWSLGTVDFYWDIKYSIFKPNDTLNQCLVKITE